MIELKRVKDFYANATSWNFKTTPEPHIEKLRERQREEFEHMLREERRKAWDECYGSLIEWFESHNDTLYTAPENPYGEAPDE